MSRVSIPASLAQLRDSSTLVVIGTVTGASAQESVNGVPFTVHTIQVTRTVKGKAPIVTKVRELGDGLEPTSLVPGTTHVLYLQPFEMTPGKATGQLVIVGAISGDYRVDLSSAKTVGAAKATRVDEEARGLPSELTVDELIGAAAS